MLTLIIAAFATANAQTVARKLHGLNYSPYIDGQNPNLGAVVTETQVRDRLSIVAPYTQWVRAFGSTRGLEFFAPVARSLGLKTVVGAWISRDLVANAAEVSKAIELANAGHADIVVVGSEALLRNDVTAAQLIAYINQVRSAIPANIPVATADTYGKLIENPTVIAASSIVFSNHYPYWEGVHIDGALCALIAQYNALKAVAGSKPIHISEFGWPTAGNAVGAAVPSKANAARFMLEATTWAANSNIPYYYFNSFDEKWKIATEGPQGEHWGMWTSAGVLKDEMRQFFDGPVASAGCGGLIEGPGTPAISMSFVPPMGSSLTLRGTARHIDASTHVVAPLIRVNGLWWTKPTFASPTVPIVDSLGNWSANIVTGGSDSQADRIAAFLIPKTFTPPLANGVAAIPSTLQSNAVASVEVPRAAGSVSGLVTTASGQPIKDVLLDGGAVGQTRTGSDGRYSFPNLTQPALVVLYPSLTGMNFTPVSEFAVVSDNAQVINFTGTQTGPDRAVLNAPVPGSVFNLSSALFSWDQMPGPVWLDVGTTPGQGNIFAGSLTGTSRLVAGLPTDGSTVYARLWTFANNAWQPPRDYTFKSCTGCATSPTRAAITSPVPGSILVGSTVTFTREIVSGATNYWLDVGTVLA